MQKNFLQPTRYTENIKHQRLERSPYGLLLTGGTEGVANADSGLRKTADIFTAMVCDQPLTQPSRMGSEYQPQCWVV